MAKNIRYTTDNRMVIESVGKDYSAGDFIVQGILHGVSINDVASGADAVVQAVGEIEYAKTAGEAWTGGIDDLYYDADRDAFTTAITADGIVRGVPAEDALSDATSGLVKLVPGRMAAAAKFVAYDNGTSDLAATTVQDAVDELATAVVDVVYTTDARLSDARTPTDHAASHATAGSDALSAADIGAAAAIHAASHAAAGTDAITPSAIGAQAVVAGAVENNLASFDAAGSTKDSGVTAASIAGAVTMGGIYNDQMRNSTDTAQSLADATATLIDLEDVELAGNVTYDAGGTSVATIPAGGTGFYAIAYNLVFAAGLGTYNRAMIYVNGALRFDVEETPDNANPIVVEDYCMLKLTAGDTVALWGKQNSGGALDVTSAYLAIQRIQ